MAMGPPGRALKTRSAVDMDNSAPASQRSGGFRARRAAAPPAQGSWSMPGPLAGLRVLELARILAGPWAGQILADLGADVIKVERKGAGDDTRGWGPPFVRSAPTAAISAPPISTPPTAASARSSSISRARRAGALVRKLAARSDILIENFKVGGLAKFGLDYASLAPENPRLIYCSVTGFGQDGPYAPRAGYDLMAQGMGGIMDLTGMPDGEPTRAGVPVAESSPASIRRSASSRRWPSARRPAAAAMVDTALVDTPGRRARQPGAQLSSFRARCRSASATRIRTSCPIRCSRSPTATSSSPPATTASSPSCARCWVSPSSRRSRAISPTPTASTIATSWSRASPP